MKLNVLAAALGVAFFPALAAGAAEPDANRVIITYKPGTQQTIESRLVRGGAVVHHRLGKQRAVAASLPPRLLQALRTDRNVVSIERDYPRYPMAQTVPYGIPRVQGPETAATGADGTGIKVCVIDSGINANHEDFAGIQMTGYASAGQQWNTDSCGHGTHVAGTIAAVDNDVGVVGVSPGKVSLHVIKVFDGASCGWAYSSSLVDAALRCQDAGAKVINMSLGGAGGTTFERTAFEELYDQGVLSIAAAGNDGNSSLSYPASYDVVMSVAATDEADNHAGFSQFNTQVEIAAPGVNVLSTYPFVTATLQVGAASYQAASLQGTVQATVSDQLVDGNLCEAADASPDWAGKIVLCERGNISFGAKVTNVTGAGGTGAVIYNNAPGNFSGTLGGNSTIPAASVSQEDGVLLMASLGAVADLSTIEQDNANGYAPNNGTSMATPHVAGVAAIAWSAYPDATPAQVRAAMTSTARDLDDPGRDVRTGFGLVQAFDATEALVAEGTPSGLAASFWRFTRQGRTFNLAWNGGAGSVDVWRDGTRVATVANSGAYVDYPGVWFGTGTITYQVCNAGTEECSAESSASY